VSNYVVTLAGFVPAPRYDSKPWTGAKIEYSATETGSYSVIDTQAFSEVDANPAEPQSRNFTTTKATAASGWYRITFYDGESNLGQAAPIFSSSQGSSSLCSLGDVKLVLQKKETDTLQDPLIEKWIPAASESIMRGTGREFAPASPNLTRVFEWPWEGQYVSLAPYDLRNLYEVKVDSDTTVGGMVISEQEYRLWPQPPADGTYLSIRLQPFGAVLDRIVWRNRQVKIRADWGFATIPRDVNHACALTVAYWLRVNSGVYRTSHEDPNPEPPRRGIPNEAWDLLARYARAVTA
jgi:hypothetical protein